MRGISDLTLMLGQLPIDRLVLILALAAFGLAAFAIHAVSSIAKDKRRR